MYRFQSPTIQRQQIPAYGRLRPLIAAAGLTLLPATSFAAEPATASNAELEERIKVLERKLEIQSEESTAKAKDTPVVYAGEKGFGIRSADGNYEIRFSGLAQVDSRDYFGDAGAFRDTFVLRRLRPIVQGSLGKYVSFVLAPEFNGQNAVGDGGSYSSIVDAYVDLKFSPYASFRIGKQKGPVGLERLQSIGTVNVNELGFVTELVPNRDIGINLYGAALGGTVNYAFGVFNGTADGRDVSLADDGQKEFEGRIFLEPFKNDYGFFRGLGFGVSGTTGVKDGTGNNLLPRYRSPGQQQFFSYNTDVQATGEQYRISPQGYFYHNSFGLLAEYAISAQNARRGTNTREIKNNAYNVDVSYVLTGENASYRGVTPSHPFKLHGGGWGAFQVFGRVERLGIDGDAFLGTGTTQLANPNTSARGARSYGAGLAWHLNANTRITTDYSFTEFKGGASGGRNRNDERALFTRLQIAY